jgi:hypothetical protein
MASTRLTYYMGFMWRTTTLPDGTRMVQPLRRDDNGSLVAYARVRYYRKPARARAASGIVTRHVEAQGLGLDPLTGNRTVLPLAFRVIPNSSVNRGSGCRNGSIFHLLATGGRNPRIMTKG